VQTPTWQVPPAHAVPSGFWVAAGQVPLLMLQVAIMWHSSGVGQTTPPAPVQMPAWQVSVVVQALLSLHALPSVANGLLQVPVDRSHVPAAWQMSDAVQTTAAPAQVPAWQVSVVVHLLLSLQLVPSAASGLLHAPVVGSQVPATWQASSGVQTTEAPAVQTPVMQDEPHPAPHTVPFGLFGLLHAPVDGLQTASWHASAPEHVFGLAPAQMPAWQLSVCVHMSPSSQVVPSVLLGLLHAPVDGSHVPAV